MSEMLQEYVDSAREPLNVDRAGGVIRGVKLLGLRSRNGRRYREDALRDAIGLYEGAKVNVNHPKGHPLSPRDYQDRLGVIRGVRFRVGEGLFGDLHFNPKHTLSEQLVWDAEHAPQNVGVSHNVLARTTRSGDETVVEAITKVQSIDLVADPATTAGLFEHAVTRTGGGWGRASGEPPVESSGGSLTLDPSHPTSFCWSELTLEQLECERPDLIREIQRGYESQLEQVRGQLDEMAAREAAARRRERIHELLQEHALPLPKVDGVLDAHLVTPRFVEMLAQAPDDDAVRQLVEERAELIRSAASWKPRGRTEQRPRSRDQAAVALANGNGRPQSAAEFAAAIRGR